MFKEKEIRNKICKNRFIRSATNEFYFTDEGEITNEYIDYYEELAKNEVGLIITGHAYVCNQGRASVKQLNLYHPSNAEKLKVLVNKVHSHGSLILMQINHAGPKAKHAVTKETVMGPSGSDDVEEMNSNQINDVIMKFCEAASLAESLGFDGVQVHGAHGYLLSSFLNEKINHRSDCFGNSVEGRAKLAFEIVKEIRKRVNNEFIISIKIDADVYQSNSDDLVTVGKLMEEAGVDLIELSGLGINSMAKDKDAYWLEEGLKLKQSLHTKIAIVGGISSKEVSKCCIDQGIDFISICRALISEVDLFKKWNEGTSNRARCIRCGKCFSNETGKRCVFENIK